MDLLQEEINRKRKLSSSAQEELGRAQKQQVGQTRFFRRGDLRALEEQKLREKERLREMERKEETERESLAKKKEDERELQEKASDKAKLLESLRALNTKEIKRRLRQLKHPVTLFGESEEERVARLFVLSEATEEDDYRLTASYSTANSFLGSKNNKDQELSGGGSSTADNNNNADDENDQEEGIEENSKSIKRGVYLTNFATTPGLSKPKIIFKYFRNLLKQWEWDLDDREDAIKRTAKGKMETKTQKQCKDYIRPLFKLCKKNEIPPDIEDKLVRIVEACEQGNFRLAHDIYLQGAIGKAAWPIGLTMVGIHERSGRERISTSKVAHVMNNELQRKYFTSVKRLMTYAQNKRDDVAPSMKSL